MSYRTIALVTAAALIGIACVSTEALARGGARVGGARVGGVHHVHHGGAYVRRGVAVGVGAAAVGAAADADIIPIRLAIEFAYAAGNDAAGRGPTGLAQLRHTSFARTSLRIRR